ncbi:uncharacterized protein LOC134455302, partial [Engraulis encrasicolus]|uniref:uncharacterized protein LOC134455302 n=1 Tax=Engraulis encrasicolus TaxID=184585 RepID=UPI002FCFA4C1
MSEGDSDDDDDDWAPPLPERTYLMDTLPHDSRLTLPHDASSSYGTSSYGGHSTSTLPHDSLTLPHDASTYGGHNASTLPHDSLTLTHDMSTLPLRGGTLEHAPPSYSASYSLQSATTTTTASTTGHRDPQADHSRPLDLFMRSPGHAPGSPYHQSCSTLMSNPETGDLTVPRLSSYWHDIMQIEGSYSGDCGKGQSSAFACDVICPSPKAHGRKKHSRDGHSRRQHNNSADLPPPPAPPPGSERLQLLEEMLGGLYQGQYQGGSLGGVRGHCSGSLEGGRARMTGHTGTGGSTGTGQRRKDRPAPWNPEDEDLLLQWKVAGANKGQSGGQGGIGGGG